MSLSFGTFVLSRISSPTECKTSLLFTDLSVEGGREHLLPSTATLSPLSCDRVRGALRIWPLHRTVFSLISSLTVNALIQRVGKSHTQLREERLFAISLELGQGLLSWKVDGLWEPPLWFISGRKKKRLQWESVILIAIRFSPNTLLLLAVKWCGRFIWRILDNPFVYWFC